MPSLTRLTLVLLLAMSAGLALAMEQPTPSKDVKVVLVFDQHSYFLGENILAHYELINTGKTPVVISMVGDYRGAPRALRFKVIATSADGRVVEDPYPQVTCMGGMGGNPTVEPGKTWWESLQLLQYCDFTRPGTYTVHVYHDLGWDPEPNELKNALPQGAHLAPIAEGKLTLVMPTPAQAREVLRRMQKLPPDNGGTWGERRKPFADYTVLRQPVYLPLLLPAAERGEKQALDGIASISTPEATRALIRLAGSKHAEIADAALEDLLQRLPSSERSWDEQTRRRLSQRAWRAEMAPAVRTLGWQLLAADDRPHLIHGAAILRSLGTKDDLPRFLQVFDRVLTAMKDDPVEQQAYLRPENACDWLLATGEMLLKRGAAPPATPHTPAEAALFISAVHQRADFRPAGWQQATEKMLQHPIPFIRATTVQRLPLPLEAPFIPLVAHLLHDASPYVQGEACNLAMKAKAPEFGEDLLAVLRTAHNKWVLDAARYAADACGVTTDRWLEVCITRLDEPAVTEEMFELLLGIITTENGTGGAEITPATAATLKQRWQAFLATHRAEIRAGKHYPIAQPPLTADLFPPGYRFYLRGGGQWPPEGK